jgi:hypothetical protein
MLGIYNKNSKRFYKFDFYGIFREDLLNVNILFCGPVLKNFLEGIILAFLLYVNDVRVLFSKLFNFSLRFITYIIPIKIHILNNKIKKYVFIIIY